MRREIVESIQGYRTQDGAGVSLVRVLGRDTIESFSPFLMLDSFDSSDPEDYIKGFPFHPHRGIETITFLSKGEMTHKDHMGNGGIIRNGQAQWMTAGSGILHEEMPLPSERMLGVQIWLNLPKKYKMVEPAYNDIVDIPEIDIDGVGKIRIISGDYQGNEGFQGKYIDVDFYDIQLKEDGEIDIPVKEDHELYLFTLESNTWVNGKEIPEKTAISTGEGDYISLKGSIGGSEILYLSAKRLDEPVAWGGPIVMNTDEELHQAFYELQVGTFIK